jgi:hypothetical protein
LDLIEGEFSQDIPIRATLYDDNIAHTLDKYGFYTFTSGKRPKLIEYVKFPDISGDVSIYTDSYLNQNFISLDKSSFKVAFLVESKILYPKPYEDIHDVASSVDLIVTHDWEIVQQYENAVFAPFSGSWVTEAEWLKIYKKTKLISCIASKNTQTPGHLLRHKLIYNFSHQYKWDLWGSGYRHFSSKVDALGPYMYTVAVQNGRYDTYFTEILTDPFLLKTIPIFWGSSKVKEIFDERGFYTFDSNQELQKILENISQSDYESKLAFIEKNYQIAVSISNSDDNLARAILSKHHF